MNVTGNGQGADNNSPNLMINSGGIIGEEMTDYLFITGTGAGAANTAGNSKVVEATATNNGGAAANIQKNKVAPQSEDEDEEGD